MEKKIFYQDILKKIRTGTMKKNSELLIVFRKVKKIIL